MLDEHKAVLAALEQETRPDGEMCVGFSAIMDAAEMADRRTVRRITRHLARRGLAAYHRGLWTDEGEPAGAGYCITHAGLAALDDTP